MTRNVLKTLWIVAAVLGSSTRGYADVTKAQCVDADTNAQSLRRDGKFTEARATLAVCSDSQCPALVRDDCTRQLDALAQEQPTVVFDAKDPGGTDLTAVRVSVDGRQVTEKLDGTPLSVDRGEHAFTFVTDGHPPVILTLVIKDAEKQRRVTVTVGEGVEQHKPQPRDSGAQRTVGLVVGGAGAIALGVGTIFGALAASSWSSTKSDCDGAGNCPSYSRAIANHNATVSDATISTIGFIAGAALLGTGAALFFTAPHSADTSAAVGIGPGTVVFAGRF